MVHRRTPAQSVLLIDDDADCRWLYATALEHAGFRVMLAETGAEGIRLAAERHPDVILLDLRLPDMHGADVARAIRRDPQFRDTPIVAITASVSRHDRAELLAEGFTDALLKPIYPALVVKAVQGWFAGAEDE